MKFYVRTCKKIEQGKKKPTKLLFAIKKLFCIPWLVVGEFLINNYKKDTLRQPRQIQNIDLVSEEEEE